MKFLLCSIAIVMMFSGGHCYSASQSCSTVNGKTICHSEKSEGNVAGASSQSGTGGAGTYQSSSAMTGNTGTGDSYASQTSIGNVPNYPAPGFGPPGYAAPGQFNPFAFAGVPNPMFGGFGGAFAFGR